MRRVRLRTGEGEETYVSLPRELGLPASIEYDVKGVVSRYELATGDRGGTPVYVAVATLEFTDLPEGPT